MSTGVACAWPSSTMYCTASATQRRVLSRPGWLTVLATYSVDVELERCRDSAPGAGDSGGAPTPGDDASYGHPWYVRDGGLGNNSINNNKNK
jgi:hypothetical protein